MTFRQYLEMKFLAWQQDTGGRRTVLEFAEYLGVSQSTISSWWNNTRQPQGENIRKVAEKLGLEVYDVLGLPRPDPDLHFLQAQWENLTAEERRALREQAEQYTTKNETRKSARKQRSATP